MVGSHTKPSLASIHASLAAACLMLFAAGCGDSIIDENATVQAEYAVELPPARPQLTAASEAETGKRRLAEGKYEEAVKHFTRVLDETAESIPLATVNESEADLFYQRGLAYLHMGFPDTAVEDFSAAINLLPQHGDAYEQRARAFVALGDMYKSLRDCTMAIRLKPGSIAAYYLRGQVYLRRAQPDRAVADLQHALRNQPDLEPEIAPLLAEAYFQWSRELEEAGDTTGAAEKLGKARELDSAYVETQLAAVAAAPAPAPVEQTVAKPVVDEADESFERGRELQLKGQYDQALIAFTEAIALRRNFREAYLRRGETLLALGFPDTALEDLKRAADRVGDAEAFRLQAQAHMELDNPHRAVLSATEALHEDPTHAETYALRGEAYRQLENWERAIADLEEAIRRDPALQERLQTTLSEVRAAQANAVAKADGLETDGTPE